MIIQRQAIIDTAMSYLGTPFHHQGRAKGVGVDCVGLIACVMRELGVSVVDRTDYPMHAIPHEFVAAVRANVPQKAIADRLPGDMIIIAPRNVLQHAAIMVSEDQVIHAPHDGVVCLRRLDDWAERVRYCFDLTMPL